ncbi:MAG: hypothetical protein AB7S75_16620 [Desulfococcaceae bacterium]
MSNNNLLNMEKERKRGVAQGIYSTLNKIVEEFNLDIDSSDRKSLNNYRNTVINQLRKKIDNKKKKEKKEINDKDKRFMCSLCAKRFGTIHALECHEKMKHNLEHAKNEPAKLVYPERKGSIFDYYNDYNSFK